MSLVQIDTPEFRDNLAGYLESSGPAQNTKRVRALGVFIPTDPDRVSKRERFYAARAQFDDLISPADQETILQEFIAKEPHVR
ncbi:MAG: hypothetical protein FWG25_09275 [Promicromonosporaceae bacterium]|nr:hypothetical protein [Promicromonosporaceae bacterium]